MDTRHVAVIAGGMGDIGRAISTQLAQDGFRIAVLYHKTPADLADTFVHSLGKGHGAFACDIVDSATVGDMVARVEQELGPIHTCVHAATGTLVRKGFAATTPGEFRSQFEVALFGGFNLFHAVAPHMRRRHAGSLVGITTALLDHALPAGPMAGYLCAKRSLQDLLRGLAQELAAEGIAVNAVAPKFVPTKLHHDLPEIVRQFLIERTPKEQRSTLAEVAETVSYICSPRAAGRTGLSFPAGMGEPTAL